MRVVGMCWKYFTGDLLRSIGELGYEIEHVR